MKITYLFHSGFMIEGEKCILIFDYYKSSENLILPNNKKIIFFASHTHPDHFSPLIFNYNNPSVTYCLSHDIEEKIVHRGWLDTLNNPNIIYVKPYEHIEINDISIDTLKSTDRGVAFLIKAENHFIYHAGDLNEWNFEKDEDNKATVNNMRALYQREINKIPGDIIFDFAFIPLDHRLGKFYKSGPLYFINKIKVLHFFPMHMWEKYEYTDLFQNEPDYPNINTIIHHPDTSMKSWIL